ncbi:IopA [Streptomyces sp. NPDC093510]|uniref:IopA n=1 Tax=Streptomyces sp. NPDC093510 TaxID=3155199 RepID=UPI00341CAE55
MRYYEEFATGDICWTPYVMFFNRPGHTSPTINTDSGGFRLSVRGESSFSLKENRPDAPVNVVLGASPAFGLGASDDAHTIPSLLSQGDFAGPWLNLAAPAFNSTQETLLFLMHRDELPAVRNIIVYSGLNDLVVGGLPDADSGYGQFFFSGEFFRQLGVPAPHSGGRQPGWAQGRVAQAARRLSGEARQEKHALADPEQRIDIAARATERNLNRLVELAAPTGARVHFALQATAAWSGKRLTEEERLLIEENYSKRSQMWDLFRQILDPDVHASYAQRLEAACKRSGVPFLDVNQALDSSPHRDSWLFVDQTHCTDEGNRVVTDILRNEFAILPQ